MTPFSRIRWRVFGAFDARKRMGGARASGAHVVVLVASALGALLTLATVATFLDGVWWLTDLLANLRVQYAFGFLVLSVIFALVRTRSLAVICVVGVLANAAVVLPLYLERPAPPADGSGVLEIMFLNTEIRGVSPDALIEDLRTARHDLIFLSAATDGLAETMESAAIPYRVAQARPRGTSLELLLLAREGLSVETAIRQFGSRSRDMAIEARVNLGGTTVRVLGVHPVSPATRERAERNARHLEGIAAWARIQADPVVIVGDLNSTPWSPVFRELLRDGGLINSQSGFGIQASWPALLGPLGIPIDHVLHSEELTTLDRTLGPGYGSSHRSLQVAIGLRDGT